MPHPVPSSHSSFSQCTTSVVKPSLDNLSILRLEASSSRHQSSEILQCYRKYMINKSASISGTPGNESTDALEGEKVDMEKASDFQLVDWVENDPEVLYGFDW
jgi:hypothetical protein